VSFVDDPTNPHLLMASRIWNFYSQVAVIDIDLDMTTYSTAQVNRSGGGDYPRAVAWDPTRDVGADRGFIYDGEQDGGKLTVHAMYVGGYPPTSTAGATGYSDPPEITAVVTGRTWSGATQSFFTATGATIYETQSDGTLVATTDIAAWLPAGHVIQGLANDDIRDYLWVMSSGDGGSGFTGYVTALSVGLPTSPQLNLVPSVLNFQADETGANPSSQSVTVGNVGGGSLSWTATSDPADTWLSLTNATGSDDDSFDAHVDITGLAPDTYQSQITVSDPDASNDPQVVAVTLVVNPATPIIQLSTTQLDFDAEEGGSNPSSQGVTVTNGNGGVLAWTAAVVDPNDAWLSLTGASGGDGDTFLADVDISGLVPDTYAATITVSDPSASNTPQTVSVSLLVRPQGTGAGADTRTERWGANSTAVYAGSPMDAEVDAASPASHLGGSDRADISSEELALLYFDLSNLQASDAIYRATLRMWTRKVYRCCTAYQTGSVFEAYAIRDEGKPLWSESQCSYNERSTGVPWSDTGSGDILTALEATPVTAEWYTTWSSASTDHPHFQSVDVTSLVQEWAAGARPNHGVALKLAQYEGANPALHTKEYAEVDRRPYLEITYYRDGQGNPNRPLQPGSIQAFHRQGQTFITFDEIATADPLDLAHAYSLRYRVYRHTEPITSANILSAQCVADLSRDSSKIQFALGFAEFTSAFGDRHVIQDYGAPLAAGTGLFVYTVKPGDDEGTHHYAVTAVVDGSENVSDFDLSNTVGPIGESHSAVKRPVAVADSADGNNTQYMMWMDYDWEGLYGQAGWLNGVEPIYGESYAFGFRVGKPGEAGPYPLVMRLNAYGAHGIALSSSGPEDYSGSNTWIGLSGCYTVWHDDNFRLWHFGHANNLWTGRPPLAAYGAKVCNYREAFYDEILEWMLSSNFAAYNVDAARMYVSGGSMGGSGAFSYSVHRPHRWAGMMSNEGITNWATADGSFGGTDWQGGVEDDWGKVAWALPVYDLIDAAWVSDDVWDHQNLGAYMVANRGGPVTLMTTAHGTCDNTIEWLSQGYPWYLDDAPYEQAAYPMFGEWQDGGHTPDVKPDKSPMFFGRVDEPLLCFANSNNNDTPSDQFCDADEGQINKELEWSNSANNFDGLMTETTASFDCSIRLDPGGAIASDTVDVTPRRLQSFAPQPGASCNYTVTDIVTSDEVMAGTVVADSDALITIIDLPVSQTGVRVHIEVTSSDSTAPAAVADLAAGSPTVNSIDLTWTAPGDDGGTGTASSYDVRYSTSVIDAGNWASATQATGEPTPSVAGSAEGMTVSGLSDDTTYYFAIKTSDEVPNESDLSNVPSATTLPAAPTVWNVSTVIELENAVRDYSPGDEIVLAVGTYVLDAYLILDNGQVLIHGATADPNDVILQGPGMNTDVHPKEGLVVGGDDVTIEDMTIQGFYYSGIHIQGENDADRTVVRNVKVFDCGERYIKCSTDLGSATKIAEDVLIENVYMEQTQALAGHPDLDYIGGIDGMGIDGWTIRDCTAVNIQGATAGGRGGIFLWQGATDCTVERNLLLNCDRGIAMGNVSAPTHAYAGSYHVSGGIVRNNFIVRGDYIGLELCFTNNLKVYHNTVYSEDAGYFRTVHIYGASTTNLQSKYNIIRGQIFENGASWTDQGSLVGSTPQADWFVAPLSGDLHLTANAVAALDAGAPLAEVTDDYDTDVRGSTPDIGADETGQAPPEPVVQFDVTASSGDESVTTVYLSVSLDQSSGQTVTVDFAVTGGSAVNPDDYTIAASPLTFDPGITSQDIVITVVDDGLVESDETIEVTLSNPSNATLGANTVHTYTINDNDAYPSVDFDLVSSSGDESATPASLAVSLSAAYVQTVTVDYAVTGGDATGGGVDYTLAAGTLTFDPNDVAKTIDIAIVDDGLVEADETIEVTLSNPSNATLGANTVHTYTINDNDVYPSVDFDLVSSSGDESATPASLAVSLSAAYVQVVTVDYAVTGGDATGGGVDYTLAAGTLTFDPNDTGKTIDIAVVDDGLVESDETIEVTLSNPVNATLGANTVHTYTINDNDAYPSVDFDLVSSSGDESATPASLAVSLSAAYVQVVTVDYAVTGGDATGGGVDYTLAAGTLTFDPNDVSKSIDINIVDDAEDESDETVEVTLSDPSNATLGANTVHTYTILDNDEPADTTPPADITDLAAGSPTASSIQLTWTAPGDDGATGTASSYDVRYSTSSIDEGNWAAATQATGEPAPQVAGSAESFTVTGLSAETTYYFAIKTSDEVPNESGLSNVPSASTTSGGSGDAVAHWDLDENAGTTANDVTGNGNDGTLGAGATWTTGKYGSAVHFNDDNATGFIEGNVVSTVNVHGPLTMAAWVLPDVAPHYSDMVFSMAQNTGAVLISIKSTGSVKKYGDVTLVSPATGPPTGQWYHLCYTYDGTTHRIYINGDEQGNATTAQETGVAQQFRIGNTARFGGQPMLGKVDDVRLYDRELSPTEVDQLYQGAPTNQAPTVDAGADDSITLPTDTVNLDGTVSDDGLPDPPGAYTVLWTKDTGPGTVTFGDANAVDTTATFSTDGVYVLQLEADDSLLQTTDTVTITVNAEPQPTVAFDTTSSSGDESVTPASLAVSLSAAYVQTVTVDYAVTGGDATGGGVDYTLAAGTLTFDPYDTSEAIDIAIVDDGDVESDETIEVTLSNPSNATLGTNTVHTYTILDNDVAGGPKLEYGALTGVDDDWVTVTLGQSYTSMVVVCTPNYGSGNKPHVVRVTNASGNSFDVSVQTTDGTAAESIDVYYMVVEEGVYTQATDGVDMEASKFTSTITDENNSWYAQSVGYSGSYSSPVVFGQVMTFNDPLWSVFWCSNGSRSTPPNSSSLYVGKHVGEDPVTARNNEVLGYVVIESGSGTMSGVSYWTALGSDIVRGPDNTPPYTYNPGASGTVTVGVATMAAMDGGNGGWAALYGASPVGASYIDLIADEDQANDAERKHTTEQVGYIVFAD